MLKVAWGPHSGLVIVYWGPLEMSTPLQTGAGEHPTFYLYIPCFRHNSFQGSSFPQEPSLCSGMGVMSCSLEKLKCMHMCILFPPPFPPYEALRQPASLCISKQFVPALR